MGVGLRLWLFSFEISEEVQTPAVLTNNKKNSKESNNSAYSYTVNIM